MKRPAFQFYPADWRKDVELQSCSMAAQGLWINLICLAHECEPYGHLTINGRPMTFAQLGRQVGLSARECEQLAQELLDAGVARMTAEGVIYSGRMVRDEQVRNSRASGGKAGAEHGAKGAEHGAKGGRPTKEKGGSETPLTDPQKPPPSSSSSSSPSGEEKTPDGVLSPAVPTTSPAGDLLGDMAPAPAPLPACPHRELLALFRAKCPTLPQPRPEMWPQSTGAEAMRQRWKWLLSPEAVRENGTRYATTADEALEWFGKFFDAVHASDFLSGRNNAWKSCDLSWLMKRENFAKVVQGNYTNERGGRA